MAGALGLVSKLPIDVFERISQAEWVEEKGREESCSLVESFLSQDADFKQLVGRLSQVEGSPLQKHGPTAEDWKGKGNEAFKIGAWEKTIDCYTKALQYAPHDQAGKFRAALFSNRAAALKKQGQSTAVVTDCTRAIKADAHFGKAWYRRGKAKAALRDYDGAVSDFEMALEIEVEDFSPKAAVGNPLVVAERGQEEGARCEAKQGGKTRVSASANAQQIETELKSVQELLQRDRRKLADGQDTEACRPGDVPNQSSKADHADRTTKELNGSVQSTLVLNGAEEFHEQGKGRGLRACKLLEPGEVFISEQPFAAVLLKANRAMHCHHCFAAFPPNPLPCKGCAGPLFCTEACRDAALGQCTVGLNSESQRFLKSSASEACKEAQSQGSKGEVSCVKQNDATSLNDASSEWEAEPKGAGFFGWHQHECGGASWPAILPPDAVLAMRALAELQDYQASSREGPPLARKVTSLCDHLDRVPKDERPILVVQACVAARCSHFARFKVTPADVLLMTGRLRANVMAVNEVTWKDERPVTQTESPFAKQESLNSNKANGELQKRADLRSLSPGTLGTSSETQSKGIAERLGTQEESQQSYAAEVSNLIFKQTQLGQALYRHASLLNHSCDPNAAVSFEGNRLTVRAVKRVSGGSELTLSYGPQKGETRTAERRKWLWERYAFLCNCTACTEDQSSDVLLTGLRCPTANCRGVIPVHTATGSFSFAASQAPEADTTISSATRAAGSCDLDTTCKSEDEIDCSVKPEVCSDCLVDQAEVTCDECGGRKLCLECDSHVHQPRSKRRAGHVRHRLEDDSDKQRLVKKVAALSVTEEGSGSISKSMPQKDGGICKLGHRDSVTSEASKSNESNMKCNLEQQPVNEQDRKEPETRRVIKDTEQSVMTGTSAPQEAGLFDAGRSEHTVEHRIPSRSQAPSTAAVSRVERGRCPVCGMSVDVSEAEVLLAAAWEGVKGSMPYLEAAKRALLASRGILHPLNRTLAEYEDQLAEAHAQAGRYEEARDHCGRSLKILEHHYPCGSLPLGHEYAKLASIARAAGNVEAANEAAVKAANIFTAHHGQAFHT